MSEIETPGSRPDQRAPDLRAMVVVASRALALLDAPRLQELALCCEALNQQLSETGQKGRAEEECRRELASQAAGAGSDMAVFQRVLEATQSNLKVMRRLRAMRLGELEYKVPDAGAGWQAAEAESGDGND